LQVKGFKALLDEREATHAALEKAKKSLAISETQKAAGVETTKGSMFAKYSKLAAQPKPLDEVITAAKATVEHHTELLKAQTGALFGRELEKFDAERDTAYSKVVGMVVVAMLKVQEDVTSAFNDSNKDYTGKGETLTDEIKKSIKNYDTFGDDATTTDLGADYEGDAE